MTAKEIIEEIYKRKGRITGSYARGEETVDSDFDFYITESQWRKLLNALPKNFESVIVGHVGFRTELGLIDISIHFRKQKEKLETRELFGLEFKTW